jgi:hypothetical protein
VIKFLKKFIDYFGNAVLAANIDIIWPDIPKFDKDGVEKVMGSRTVNTVKK